MSEYIKEEATIFPDYQPRPLPNSTAVLVLGILSILGCCCYFFTGLILSIIALYLARKDEKLYRANPYAYTPASYSNLKAGRICAIVGLVLFGILLLLYIVAIAMFGIDTLTDPEAIREALERMKQR